MSIIYRPLIESDYIFLMDMLYEALFVPLGEAPFNRSILEEPDISKYISNWPNQKYDIGIIAICDDELIGAIWGRLFKKPNIGYGYYNDYTPEISMAVKSSFRNRGIGTKLIKLLSQKYLAKKFATLSLSVDQRNEAIKLYKRQGFKTIAIDNFSCTMVKKL